MKSKLLIVTALVFLCGAVTSSAQNTVDSPMSQAWVLGSKLSVAASLHAQGGEAGMVGRQFAQAAAAAGVYGIKLPPLPSRKGNRVEDSATALNYLLNQTGSPIGGMLIKSHGAEHAAIFEIALKSNILLMMYGPGESTTDTIVGVIRARSANAKYVAGMTAKLLELIQNGAAYEAVKSELFHINDLAPKYLALIEYSRNGDTKYASKDYSGSAAEFTKALAIDPTGAEYFYGRARAHAQLGKSTEAIADYSKVIQLEGTGDKSKKNLSVAYYNRGLLLGIAGKNAQAIADLTNAIKLRPDYASAFKVRGLVYHKMGNTKLAAADLQTAERLQPGITK